jgi:hypothetical protein
MLTLSAATHYVHGALGKSFPSLSGCLGDLASPLPLLILVFPPVR